MEKGLVSIIVPVYNAELYLQKCISSIQKQTYSNYEVILVDDGSTDGSSLICDTICQKDKRYYVIHKPNGGVSTARNVGIDRCRGEYVTFLDSDDELDPRYLEVLTDNLSEENADISAARSTRDDYEWVGNSKTVKWMGEEALINSLKDVPLTYSVWGKIYTRSIIGDIRFEPELCINEDSFFVFLACLKKPVFVSTSEKLYVYNNNPESASNSAFTSKYRDVLAVSQKKKAIVRQAYPHLEELAINACIKAKMNYLEILSLRTGREMFDEEKKIISEIKAEKRYFIPFSKRNKMWMFLISHNLYFVYKIIRKCVQF